MIELAAVFLERSTLAKGMCFADVDEEDTSGVGSTIMALSSWSCGGGRGGGTFSGRTMVPSEICLNIRFTAIIPAAPVSAARSAPTYPGVAFARVM